MRISDWSSDVCSSDLRREAGHHRRQPTAPGQGPLCAVHLVHWCGPGHRAGGRTSLGLPAILKGCIAGCESVERTGEHAYEALVAVKIGPVSTRFKGKLRMTDGQPPHSYTLHFDGQGGVAGFGKGPPDLALGAEGEHK